MLKALVACTLFGVALGAWDYSDHRGNDDDTTLLHWCGVDERCCPDEGTGSQSPINIRTNKAEERAAYLDPRLSFTGGYFSKLDGTFYNNGHGLKFEPGNKAPDAIMTGGPFGCKEFKFAQFHIHWGEDEKSGSEHLLDGKQFAGEIHLVHYNTKYESVSDAAGHDDGLAVLGFFLKDASGSDAADQPFMNAIDDAIKDGGLEKYEKETDMTVSLSDILCAPSSLDEYYSYAGSLTTPTCNEAVTWVVFAEPIEVDAKNLLARAREIEDSYGNTLILNWRNEQDLAGRTVYTPPL